LQALGAVLLDLAKEDGSPFVPHYQTEEGKIFWGKVYNEIAAKSLEGTSQQGAFSGGIADLKKRKTGDALGKLFSEVYMKHDSNLLEPTKTKLSDLIIR